MMLHLYLEFFIIPHCKISNSLSLTKHINSCNDEGGSSGNSGREFVEFEAGICSIIISSSSRTLNFL